MLFRIIAFVIFMVPSYLMAQGNCCCCLLKEAGQKAERDGNLRTAISEWDDAKKCSDVGRCPELNNLIASAKAKIEEEARDIGKVKQCEDEIERLKGQISQFNNRLNKSESENDNLKSEKVKLSRQITEYEDKIWEIVDSTNNVDIYKAYCREFPNGKYSRIAKQKSGGNSEISTTPELARVPGGNFQMGYSDAPVQVNTFYLSKFEVTNAQYCIFLNEMGNQQVGNSSWINIGGTENGCPCKIIPKGTKFQVQSGFENHPVAFVTWYGASSYCEWLSNKTGKFYHLPSRAQWEYAAGNGVKHTTYSWGFENPIGKEGGNILDVSYGKYINKDDENEIRLPYGVYDDGYVFSAPVGSFSPNDFGVYDMSGNVWEWCADVEASTSRYNANENKRAIKGGSWNCIKSYSETKYFKDGKEVFGYKPGYKPRKFDTTKELIKFEDYEYSVDDNNYRSNGYKIANEVSQEQYFNSATIGFRVAVDSL